LTQADVAIIPSPIGNSVRILSCKHKFGNKKNTQVIETIKKKKTVENSNLDGGFLRRYDS
jgi:hypothetical protein